MIPGRAAALPFPRTGEAAVGVGGLGMVASTKNERSIPVASVTKLMTAYIVLKDHPLHGRSGGPIFTMTAADHQAWIRAAKADESNIEVKAGERLDERQLLQALMIPSADNIANYLAVWDAGSMRAFVAKMNAAAAALHLRGTHFADPSGLSPGSRGTAVDIVRLAAVALQNPELRQIVDEQFIRLPVMGKIWNNYDPAVGVDGIIGGKSGYTPAAQTNLVTAAWRTVRGHRVLVVCDVLDQPDSLVGDAGQDEALLNAVTPELAVSRVMPAKAALGVALATWSPARSVVRTSKAVVAVGWPGLRLRTRLVPLGRLPRLARGWPAGSIVGTLEVEYPSATLLKEPAILQSSLGKPPPGWVPSASPG
ncbi:MAG: D-alanyl-D-alanine carboxypeptidase family protein [Acidimicrobiales bacterium]